MGIKNKIAQYREYKKGVSHCTFNPSGPGVVRIHLVPPRFSIFKSNAYIVILNGYYLLPIGYSWALILSYFMREVNRFDGKPISEEDEAEIVNNTVRSVKSVFGSVSDKKIRDDLDEILGVLFSVARGAGDGLEIEKISIRRYGKNMTAPHRVDLAVSSMTDSRGVWKCNQRCLFCYAAGQKMAEARELSTDEWKNAIDRLYKAGVPMVTFTGGEPTEREDITELVSHAKRMVTRLNTNGINLTDDLVLGLKSAGLDSLQVTLYSYDEGIHNGLVGCARFKDTVAGIRRAVDAGLDVSVNTPLCKRNKDYLKTLEFIRSLGVRFATLSGLICTGMADINHEDYDLSEDELFDAVKQAKEYADSNEMEIDFTSPGLIKRERLEEIRMNVPMCGACLSNMAISPDGTVVPCQSWLSGEVDLGNILTDNFKKIWNHPAAKKMRKMTEAEALFCPFRKKKGGGRV